MNRPVFTILVTVVMLIMYGLYVMSEKDEVEPLAKSESEEIVHKTPSLEGLPKFSTPIPDRESLPLGAIPEEKIFTFTSEEDFQKFVAALAEGGHDLAMKGRIDALRSVRVHDPHGVAAGLLDRLGIKPDNGTGGAPNFMVTTPRVPVTDERTEFDAIAFANNALEFLGIDPIETTSFGKGVKIAILDSGVIAHGSFRAVPENTVLHPDAGPPSIETAGHGTAVASIIGSTDRRVPGIAPEAELLSYAVFGPDGFSDSFTLAEAIVAATDAGAQVINASLGSFGDSSVVRAAVDYASERGAVVVAASGNEQAAELAYPARYENVLAVGAVDASGQQVTFSNAGPELDLVGPGLGIFTLGAEGSPVSFSGTSASTPFVSGTIAALMSAEPGLSGQEAAALLVEYANEAGPPGFDEDYGYGIPNLSRVLRRDEPNLRDPALAGNHIVDNGDDTWSLQVIVENRGTSPLSGPKLTVTIGDQTRVATGPTIPENGEWVKEFPVSGPRVRRAGEEGLPIKSTVTSSRDIDSQNNSATTTLLAPAE